MHIFHAATSLNDHLQKLRENGVSIGFVPTMGALHQGHLALIDHAASENDEVVVSIFVNPTQFNNAEDLRRYPRNLDEDMALLENTGCTVLFLPEVEQMYPDKVESETIDLGGLDKNMEGAHRPGHFDGVATVVSRFFDIVKPNRAYFGEKDFQQLQIIRHVSRTKDFHVEVVPHSIERSNEGLALSSRNLLLSETDRQHSLAIFKNLKWAAENYRDFLPHQLKATIEQNFKKEPLELEYVEIVNEDNLRNIEHWEDAEHARIFIAAHISGVRLIDNLSLF